MRLLQKYLLVALSVLVLTTFARSYYMKVFEKRGEYNRVSFSPVTEEFVRTQFPVGVKRDPNFYRLDTNEKLSKEAYMQLRPFENFSDLVKWDKFPQKFAAFVENPRVVYGSRQYTFVRERDVVEKPVGLYPLFESASKFSNIEEPKDMFALRDGMFFYDTATNILNKEKSKLFNDALLKEGAQFPLKKAYGNPTTRKPFDEGYFITDAKDALFHVKMVKAKPLIVKVELDGVKVMHMDARENSRKEFYALVLSEDEKLYLLLYDEYALVELPVKDFDYLNKSFILRTDPLYRHIELRYKSQTDSEVSVVETIVTNLDYELVKQNVFTYKNEQSSSYTFFKKLLFPLSFSIEPNKDYATLLELNELHKQAFYFSGLLALLYLLFIKLSKRSLKAHLVPTALIAAGGIFAMLMLALFDRLYYFKEK